MANLYKKIDNPQEGTPVQFLAVYALRWEPHWGEPAYAFVEADEQPASSPDEWFQIGNESYRLASFANIWFSPDDAEENRVEFYNADGKQVTVLIGQDAVLFRQWWHNRSGTVRIW